jgi:hypothetical protein
MVWACERLDEENARVDRYLHPTTKAELQRRVRVCMCLCVELVDD